MFLLFTAFFAVGSDAFADSMTLQGITVNPHDHVNTSLPDFDGDGTVGFSDFLMFAENFGLSHGDDGFDARFDLNGDWEVGFSDFVIFSRNFGRDDSSGKLQPWDLSKIVVIDSVRSAPVGTPVFLRTVPLAKRAATWGESNITPLETPLLSTGLNRIQLHPEGSSSPLGHAVAAGLTQQRQTSFAPGRPLRSVCCWAN